MRKSALQMALEAEAIDKQHRSNPNNPDSLEWLKPPPETTEQEVSDLESADPETPADGEFDSLSTAVTAPHAVSSFDSPELEDVDVPDQPTAEFASPDIPSGDVVDLVSEPESPEEAESDLPDAPEFPDDTPALFDVPSPQIANTEFEDGQTPDVPETAELELAAPEAFEQPVEEVISGINSEAAPELIPNIDEPENTAAPQDTSSEGESFRINSGASELIPAQQDDIDYPDLPAAEFEQVRAPSQSVGEVSNTEVPESDFRGFDDLPPVTEQQIKMQELEDPSISYEERAERQYEMQRQASEDLASQLAQELTPKFDEMHMLQSQIVHEYVSDQILLATLLRGT